MPKYLTTDQLWEGVKLYREGKLTIKEILLKTDIGSEQTLYRVLNRLGIRRPRLKSICKLTISIESDVKDILSEEPNRNRSQYINEAIRFYHKAKK